MHLQRRQQYHLEGLFANAVKLSLCDGSDGAGGKLYSGERSVCIDATMHQCKNSRRVANGFSAPIEQTQHVSDQGYAKLRKFAAASHLDGA